MLGKEEIVSPSLDELKEHYHRILTLLGEDAGREGLQKTPERVAKAMLSLTKGYHMDPHEVLRSAKFQEEYSQMVIVKDIDFFSLCEHHMLPFYGKAHVAYIPNGYITGLSKIARPNEKFCFEGFLPQKKGRMTRLKALAEECRTMVFYESPHRLVKALTQFAEHFGAERQASVSREISKMHEETVRGTLTELIEHFTANEPRGEIVIVVTGIDD